MTREPDELRELLGEDVPSEEYERLKHVDALLRSAPAPPPRVPASLTRAVTALAAASPLWTRRRLAAALALAATVAGVFFAIGFWAGGGDGGELEARRTFAMQATDDAPGASALITLGPKDEASGNWEFQLEVSGLPPLPEDGYYVLWLARDGEFGAVCGSFNVGRDTTSVRMSASYRLADYDDWVVTAWLPDRDNSEAPWLLRAPTV